MPRNPPFARAGGEFIGHEGGGGDHHAVEKYGGAAHGGLCQETRHSREVGGGDGFEDGDGVVFDSTHAVHGIADGGDLAFPAFVIDAGSAANHNDGLGAGHGSDEGGGGRCITDS